MRWSLGVLVIALGAVLKRHTDRVVRASNATPPAGRLVELPGGPVHVLEEGEGPPIVLIHGSDGVVGDWPLCGLMGSLAAFGRVIAYDRPGHGHTPVPGSETVTVDLNVRLLRELLGEFGARRPVLVGHSYGATIALSYTLSHPEDVSGLVLIAPTSYPRWSLANPMAFVLLVPGLRELLLRVFLLPVGRVMMRIEGGKAFHPHPMPRPWEQMMLTFSLRPSQVNALAQENRTIMRELHGLSLRYGQIQAPCTIIAGRHDRLTPHDDHAAALARVVPGARLLTLEDAGHEAHWCHPEVVVESVRHLLAGPAAASEGGYRPRANPSRRSVQAEVSPGSAALDDT